jgi:hypothetical protein
MKGRNETSEPAEFETADLYLASAVSILLGKPPGFRVEKGKTLFIFPATGGLYRAMRAYNSGVELAACDYAQAIKRLRAEMLMRRGQVERNGR